MINALLNNTKTMTARLGLFFTLLSGLIATLALVAIISSIFWAEDRMGERRLLLDRNEAVSRFRAGEQGVIQLDILTTAYNDFEAVPLRYREQLRGESEYYEESTETELDRLFYVGEYTDKGESFPIILISEVDKLEITTREVVYILGALLLFVSLLITLFGSVLFRLSAKLIEPMLHLQQQLDEHKGNTQHNFTVAHDAAHEFHQLTEQLNQYRIEANQAIKREQAFARYSSHELRTPLTVIKGVTRLLEKSDDPRFIQKQVTRLKKATTQISSMVDALLSLVKYEKSDSNMALRPITEEEIERLVHQHSTSANMKGIDLTLSVDGLPETPATEAVITIVFGNLISNAVAATSQGAVGVNMTPEYIEVLDSGVGLQTSPSPQGHGLGLMIVDEFCRRYHWQFDLAENQQKAGCRARISFQK